MDPYDFERAIKRSADYEVPWRRRRRMILTVMTLPIWLIPYLFVRWLRRLRSP